MSFLTQVGEYLGSILYCPYVLNDIKYDDKNFIISLNEKVYQLLEDCFDKTFSLYVDKEIGIIGLLKTVDSEISETEMSKCYIRIAGPQFEGRLLFVFDQKYATVAFPFQNQWIPLTHKFKTEWNRDSNNCEIVLEPMMQC